MDEDGSLCPIEAESTLAVARSATINQGKLSAYVLASHEDTALKQLKQLLSPFAIAHFYTDGWGAYQRLLEERAS